MRSTAVGVGSNMKQSAERAEPRIDGRQQITILLERAANGDGRAQRALWERAYPELLRIAATVARGWGAKVSLCATDIGNEAFTRLFERRQTTTKGADYFFRCCARECQRILVGHWRRKCRSRRVDLVDLAIALPTGDEAEAIRCATMALARAHARAAQAVEEVLCRGSTVHECATRLGVSHRTVQLDLAKARTWLGRWLRDSARGRPVAAANPV